METVFISYKSQDRKTANLIHNFFESRGLKCWIDHEGINTGEDYKKCIEKVLPKCKALLLLLSEQAMNSKEVKTEYKLARDNKIEIYPIKIEKCKLNNYYRDELTHCQISDFYNMNSFKKFNCLQYIAKVISGNNSIPLTDSITKLQQSIIKEQKHLERSWKKTIVDSVDRCGFRTPEPEFMKETILDGIEKYNVLVDSFIFEAIANEYYYDLINKFKEFFLLNNINSIIWVNYKKFKKIVTKALGYLDENDELDREFIDSVYKDYINIIKEDGFEYPVIKLLKSLETIEKTKYDKELASIRKENQTEFFDGSSISLFVNTKYIGNEYINKNSQVVINKEDNIFSLDKISVPNVKEFFMRYYANQVINSKRNQQSEYATFIKKNPTLSYDGEENYAYLYLLSNIVLNQSKERGKEFINKYINNLESDLPLTSSKNKKMLYKNSAEVKTFIISLMKEKGFSNKTINETLVRFNLILQNIENM